MTRPIGLGTPWGESLGGQFILAWRSLQEQCGGVYLYWNCNTLRLHVYPLYFLLEQDCKFSQLPTLSRNRMCVHRSCLLCLRCLVNFPLHSGSEREWGRAHCSYLHGRCEFLWRFMFVLPWFLLYVYGLSFPRSRPTYHDLLLEVTTTKELQFLPSSSPFISTLK